MIGAIFVILLMMLVPSIPAIEIKNSLDISKTRLVEEFNAVDTNTLVQKLKNMGNPQIQKTLATLDFAKLKEILTSEPFIDIALLLVLFNSFVLRIVNRVIAGAPSKPITSMVLFTVSTLLYMLIFIAEYKTGDMFLPRAEMYQTYFSGVLLIFAIVGLELTLNSKPVLKIIISFFTGMVIALLSKYLGNQLYELLQSPT